MADNILTEIPYVQISPLQQLRTLDISHNLIRYLIRPTIVTQQTNSSSGEVQQQAPPPPLPPAQQPLSVRLTLDVLHLEYNLIEALPTASFQYFDIVNMTFLDGNPLKILGDEAFRPCRMRELYIRFCDLHTVSPLAFDSLGTSLQILDLSGNNITSLRENIFSKFDVFR